MKNGGFGWNFAGKMSRNDGRWLFCVGFYMCCGIYEISCRLGMFGTC